MRLLAMAAVVPVAGCTASAPQAPVAREPEGDGEEQLRYCDSQCEENGDCCENCGPNRGDDPNDFAFDDDDDPDAIAEVCDNGIDEDLDGNADDGCPCVANGDDEPETRR